MNTPYICAACGCQFAESASPPESCPVCEDSRGFGSKRGARQRWTTLEALRSGHTNDVCELEPGLISIVTQPKFSVGQQCVLVCGETRNVLWDCISLVDDATVEALNARGGISAIAISHPHFYGAMVEWSRAFENVPIYLHDDDRAWVLRSDAAIVSWHGDSLRLSDEFTLVRCGGHFDGGTVLHWSGGRNRPDRLLTGDVIDVVDRERVTFMHNYPKRIPLPASAVERIAASVAPFEFERVYGCWPDKVIPAGGKQVVLRSARQYVENVAARDA